MRTFLDNWLIQKHQLKGVFNILVPFQSRGHFLCMSSVTHFHSCRFGLEPADPVSGDGGPSCKRQTRPTAVLELREEVSVVLGRCGGRVGMIHGLPPLLNGVINCGDSHVFGPSPPTCQGCQSLESRCAFFFSLFLTGLALCVCVCVWSSKMTNSADKLAWQLSPFWVTRWCNISLFLHTYGLRSHIKSAPTASSYPLRWGLYLPPSLSRSPSRSPLSPVTGCDSGLFSM